MKISMNICTNVPDKFRDHININLNKLMNLIYKVD